MTRHAAWILTLALLLLPGRVRAAEDFPLEELRRRAAELAAHPERAPEPFPVWRLGAPDLPRFFVSVAARGLTGFGEELNDCHRMMLPEHLPFLVRLLPRAGPETLPQLLGRLACGAQFTDAHRETVARGLLLGVERTTGLPAPPEHLGRSGIPASFRALARLAWGLDGASARSGARQIPPRCWIRRWAFDLEPNERDRPFLELVARRANSPHAREWAERMLGRRAPRRLRDEDVGRWPSSLSEVEALTGLRVDYAEAERRVARLFVGRPLEARLSLAGRFPECVTDEALDRLVEELGDPEVDDGVFFSDEVLRPVLAIVEVRRPEALPGILESLAKREDYWQKALGRQGLALFGRTAWNSRPDNSWETLLARAVSAGLDPRAFPGKWQDLPDGDLGEMFRGLLRAGDPVGACLLLCRARTFDSWDLLPRLAAGGEPRAVAFLRSVRGEEGNYWDATLGLALAGDEKARQEILGLVRDVRTWQLDSFLDALPAAMELDPSMVDLAVARIDSNCCFACYDLWALGMRFPTLDADYETWNLPETKRRIADWLSRHRDGLRYSRILEGWLPARGPR